MPFILKGYARGELYDISGEFPDEDSARLAAGRKLLEIERAELAALSASNAEEAEGPEDHVYVVRPDGSYYEFVGFGF